MPANECIPYKEPGVSPTAKASAAVTGKRFVKPSGNRTGGPGLSTDLANVYQAAHCGAGQQALGVSKHDAANGALFGVHVAGIVPVTAGDTIAAGQRVMSDANGKAVPFVATALSGNAEAAPAEASLGVALNGAAADADCEVLLSI
jgi:hypothetical protein